MTDPPRHPDAEALLAAVCANPEDDTPRLVYADWLDENGDEVWRTRAAFIREQIRIAAGRPPLDPAPPGWQSADTLLLRYEGVWARGHPDWIGPYRHLYDFPDYRRGFLDRVRVHFDKWMKADGEARLRVPITRLEVDGADLGRVAVVPQFATVRELSAGSRHPLTADQMAAFVGPQAVARLRSLSLFGVEPPAIPVLAGADRLARLSTLRIGGGAEAVVVLEPGSALAGLTDLTLWGAGLAGVGLARLADAPGLARLTRLSIQHPAGGDAGFAALVRSPLASNLRTLDVWTPELGEAGTRAVAESPYLGNLQELRLSRSRLGRRFERVVRQRFPFVEFK